MRNVDFPLHVSHCFTDKNPRQRKLENYTVNNTGNICTHGEIPDALKFSDLTICCLKMDRAWPISKRYLRCREGRVFSLYIQTFCEEVIESQNISPNTDPQQVWLEDGDWMSRASWWNWFDLDSKRDNFYAIFISRRLPTPTAIIFLTSTTLVLYLWFNGCLQNCFRPNQKAITTCHHYFDNEKSQWPWTIRWSFKYKSLCNFASLSILTPQVTGYFEDPTPTIQVQTLPLEGPMILKDCYF